MQDIRQLLIQMLVVIQYQGDKEQFVSQFIRNCERYLHPAYNSPKAYYGDLHKTAQKRLRRFVESLSPNLRPSQSKNLRLLVKSLSA